MLLKESIDAGANDFSLEFRETQLRVKYMKNIEILHTSKNQLENQMEESTQIITLDEK